VSDAAAVDIAIGLDLSNLDRPLELAELAVLKKYKETILKAIGIKWTGWKYAGRNRATVGRSLAGWKGKEQSVSGIREIVISNDATGYYTGKPYVAYVRRSKGKEPEAELLADYIGKTIVPLMVSDLLDAILKTISDAPPKQVRENKQASYSTASLEV
jgi:hypothetical protein